MINAQMPDSTASSYVAADYVAPMTAGQMTALPVSATRNQEALARARAASATPPA